MGTRSLTRFIERWTEKEEGKKKAKEIKQEIVVMYRQFDGYPKGHGKDLAKFLSKGIMVNGIGANEEQLVFNGMGCLAAQCVAHFKDGPGNIYLHKAGSTDCWEEYVYEIISTEGSKEIELRCYDVYKKAWIFEGTPQEFLEQVNEIEA